MTFPPISNWLHFRCSGFRQSRIVQTKREELVIKPIVLKAPNINNLLKIDSSPQKLIYFTGN